MENLESLKNEVLNKIGTSNDLKELDEVREVTKLGAIFNEKPINIYKHPLVCEIDFEQVPSLAMHKYLNTFSTRDDLKDRFKEYINKVKEANELSLQLLAENPDLANQATRDKHGVLTFSEEEKIKMQEIRESLPEDESDLDFE